MSIDPKAPIPLYFQLKTLLLEEILDGRHPPGKRLPTEHQLCARFGISRTPVHRALSELAEEGVIVRHRRRGTFLNPHWLRRHPARSEIRIMVPDGFWEGMIRATAPEDVGVNVVAVALPDLHQALTHAVAEGRAPDLAILDSVWVREFAASGFLHPLDELDEGWLAEADFVEPFVTANHHDAATYAVQAEADVAGLWYRRRELEALGAVTPPRTWRALLEIARAAVADGLAHPFVMPGGSRAGETTTYCLLALLASNAVSVLRDGKVALRSREAEQALGFMRRLLTEGVLPEEVVAYEWDRSIRLLAAGQAVMSFGGSYEARTLSEAVGRPIGELWDEFGFAPIPAGPKGAPANLAGGMAYGIFRQAARPKAAVRLLQRLTAPETLADMSRATAQIAPRHSAIELVAPEVPFLAATAAMLDGAAVRPATPAYARVSAQLQSMLEGVLTGRFGPGPAVRRAAEMIGAITGLPVR